jgi:hypothetical protein
VRRPGHGKSTGCDHNIGIGIDIRARACRSTAR